MSTATNAQIEQIFREQYGRAVAVLTRSFGSIDAAEEAVQDAFSAALERWPAAGLPPSPAGWIITTARNRAIDRARRESTRADRHLAATLLDIRDDESQEHAVRDDHLRLIFTCCHPALATSTQIALTLRLLGGLTTAEIARAFLVPEATMAQRIVRAKGKIRDAGIPYRIPPEDQLPLRLRAVRATLYLIFNEGHCASETPQLIRTELCDEAIRLARLLALLMPDDPESWGLLALLLLIDARRAARVGADGSLVILGEQDRSLWDRVKVAEGQTIVRRCLAANQPGPYQIQAAINAVHSDALFTGSIDWPQILTLYNQLVTFEPTPVVALNRAVVVAEVEGPGAALTLVDELPLSEYRMFHAIRADLLRRLDRRSEAIAAYEAAIALTKTDAERAFLRRRVDEINITPAQAGVDMVRPNGFPLPRE
jgi:RNA polymerase sigma-70 factor (ECF subfamily)